MKKANTTSFDYIEETKSTSEQVEHRKVLYDLFNNSPIPDDQLLTVLGLYMRSSSLAKILFVNELYQNILDIPGSIVEFGTWWGQNIILFENLRAIYEPFNQSRRVIGFDTFKGYPKISDFDKGSSTIKEGGYTVSDGYITHLNKLVDYHEKNNILGNIKKHRLIEGDVKKTVPKFFKEHPEEVIALAYFDMALYEPTVTCMKEIIPRLIPGSIVMLDEFNSKDYPGETIAFWEAFKSVKYEVKKSKYMTDRTYLIIKGK